MYGISRVRAGGKTHELILKYFLRSDRILAVMNESERQRIIVKYKLSEEDRGRIVTWKDAEEGSIKGRYGDILIDNVDTFLMEKFHKEPIVVTFTGWCNDDINRLDSTRK